MSLKDVNIRYDSNDTLKLSCFYNDLGSQYDNKATTLLFKRPPGHDTDSLILLFANKKKKFGRVNIEQNNDYEIVNALTQETELSLQVAFERNNEIIAHTNVYKFTLNPSIKPGNQEIEEIESEEKKVWKAIAESQTAILRIENILGDGSNTEEIQNLKAENELLKSNLKSVDESLDLILGEVIE